MRAFALTIFAVAVTTALLVFGSFLVLRRAAKMEDPKFLRRHFLFKSLLYAVIGLFLILNVATGDFPPIALIGLPITAVLVWSSIKQAGNVKIPPSGE